MTAPSALVATVARGYVRHAPGGVFKAAIATRLNAWLRDHPRERITSTRFGARFHVDTQDLIQRYIYMYGAWEPHMMRWLETRLRAGDTFVDVGANIGALSLYASHLVGETGTVVAIEASPAFHQRLLENAEVNRCASIRAVNAAVSDRAEPLTFVLASARNMGANSIVPWQGPAESTFTTTAHPLPDLLHPDELGEARVIKIDVEGAEGAVIRGLAPLLDTLHPQVEIAVEVAPDRMQQIGDDVTELLETLHRHGFHTYRLENSYAAASYPAALRRPRPPVRWRGPVTAECDLIFSRIDAETLEGAV